MNNNITINYKPFVKWVGGKTQIIKQIRERYPVCFNSYCEPFVGGGAVLFDILTNYNLNKVMINDINFEIINCYIQIKNQVDNLILMLKNIENQYYTLNDNNKKEHYYNIRNKYNELLKNKSNLNNKQKLELATYFIFLNKTCFNGLYRVNSMGLFNTPSGVYKHPTICDENNLKNISYSLKNVIINCGDFEDCLDFIKKDTFVYLDPPYKPITKTQSFTSYTKNKFDDNEQVRLYKFINKINKKGANILLSNSDPTNINKNDLFFDELYKDYKIDRVLANRMINSVGTKRDKISELLISNY